MTYGQLLDQDSPHLQVLHLGMEVLGSTEDKSASQLDKHTASTACLLAITPSEGYLIYLPANSQRVHGQ
jgi:hypothetical protein